MSEILGFDAVNKKLERMLAVGGLSREARLEIGLIILSEFQENFRVGGRPTPWPKSQRVLKKGGQTLRKTGHLIRSIAVNTDDNSVAIGSNLPYARIHAFGGDIVRYPHSRLGVAFRKRDGKTQFARKGLKRVERKNITVGRYIITIDQRDYTYISQKGASSIGATALRHMKVIP